MVLEALPQPRSGFLEQSETVLNLSGSTSQPILNLLSFCVVEATVRRFPSEVSLL